MINLLSAFCGMTGTIFCLCGAKYAQEANHLWSYRLNILIAVLNIFFMTVNFYYSMDWILS